MPICVECGKHVITNYQTIKTKRKTVVHICNPCISKTRVREADSARDSK